MTGTDKIKGNPRMQKNVADSADLYKSPKRLVGEATKTHNPRLNKQLKENASNVVSPERQIKNYVAVSTNIIESGRSASQTPGSGKNKTNEHKKPTKSGRQVSTIKKVEAQAKRKKRKEEASKRKGTKKPRRISTTAIVISVVAFLVVGCIAAYFICANTDVFEIQEVEYKGADHLTSAEVEALSPDVRGQSLLNFNRDLVSKGLTRTSWINSVDFTLEFPHKLVVNITEQKVGAVVDFAQGANQTSQSWIITLDGTWIMAVPNEDSDTAKQLSSKIYEDVKSAIHITDVPNGVAPEIGKKSTDETVLNALSIVTGFTTSLKDDVKTIKASSISATTIELNNNIEVAFGTADQIRDKERIVQEIIAQQPKVVFINVRTPDRPTWRAV